MKELVIVTCLECCEVEHCSACLEIQHEDCDEDCAYCWQQSEKRERERYVDAQFAYYAPGGEFEWLMGGPLK